VTAKVKTCARNSFRMVLMTLLLWQAIKTVPNYSLEL
jgi:hypothetical protein